MKLFVLLLLLFTPVDVHSSERSDYQLSCKEYEFLVEGLRGSEMKQSIKVELMSEFIKATDPQCFS